ncbi:MAG TPA: alpha/beta hydrolase [Candidatus Limnocylindrales bacterium]
MKAFHLPENRAFIRYLEIPGDDPPLLWVHGWQCSSSGELLPVAVQPALRGRRSLVIDLLGHGYSDKPHGFAYTTEEHARTIIALIDGLGIPECGLVGHSMGGGIAIHVAAARPSVVSLLVMAEGNIDADGEAPFDGQSEAEFVERGFGELLAGQSQDAEASPTGLRAAHVEMTRIIEPRALFREAVSMASDTDPSIRSLLGGLSMSRWYLNGALSEPDGLEADLAAMGVGWKVVPDAGHPMGLQNPAGVADCVAEAIDVAWPGRA